MILLDTNVLSELMKPSPAPQVVAWLDSQEAADIWISSIVVAEIYLGIELLDPGRRQTTLYHLATQMFEEEFSDRCLVFDARAGAHYAVIVSGRRSAGRPICVEDAQIAAIARANELTLATRNTKDFQGITDLQLMNPWRKC